MEPSPVARLTGGPLDGLDVPVTGHWPPVLAVAVVGRPLPHLYAAGEEDAAGRVYHYVWPASRAA